jgi:hypothetical protein
MEQVTEKNMPLAQRQIVRASDYSARIQQAMRYDRLRSSEYSLVMTIMDAVLQGNTEEHWQKVQQRTINVLLQQPPEKGMAHTDAENRYEQTVNCLKDLALWPW